MPEFGLTDTGFLPKRAADVRADLEEAIRAEFGAGVATAADTGFGRLIGVVANALAEVWEAQQGIYSALYPSTAAGASLDGVLELSALRRLAAEASTVWARLDGTDGTVVPAGADMLNATTGDVWRRLTLGLTIDADDALRADAVVSAANYAVANTFTISIDGFAYLFTAALYAITATDVVNDRFTIAGDHRTKFPVGSAFTVSGSTTNDGAYTVQARALVGGNTQIDTVEDVVAPGVALGSILPNQNTVAVELQDLINLGDAITAIDTGTRTITVAGDQTTEFPAGQSLEVFGSTGNDGDYGIVSRTFAGGNTTIVVAEDLPSAVVNGRIRRATADGVTTAGTCRVDIPVPATADDASDYGSDFALAVGGGTPAGSLTFGMVGSAGLLTGAETGPQDVAAAVALQIVTAVAGWTGAVTVLAADVGRDQESDAAARARRAQSLRVAGAGTVEAIRARLLEVDGVDSATVYENATDAVDGEGRPPHSVECVVQGGTAAAVALAIWNAKPAGIETQGNTSQSITDTQGFAHTIEFSRVTNVTMHVRVNVTALYAEEDLPDDAADLIRAAVVTAGEALAPGVDVIAQRFVGPIFAAVPGILSMDVTVERDVAADPPPADATEAIAARERPRFATARVVVLGV